VISRRAFLAAGAGTLAAGCGHQKSTGFPGYAFVANEEGHAIAVVDLTAFAVIKNVHLNGNPTAVIADPRLPHVYALTPASGTVHKIGLDRMDVRGRISAGASAVSMRLSPDARSVYVLYREPRKLVSIGLESFRPERQIALPEQPFDFDLSTGRAAAVSFGDQGAIAMIDLRAGRLDVIPTASEMGILRFQGDGKALIAADVGRRMLQVYDVASRRLIVRLPLAVRPDHFCFNDNGGQLFITGDGLDAVVVVFPYHTPEVFETVLAGHCPGAMAASGGPNGVPKYLFIANPPSGDVSVMHIDTRKVVLVAPAGSEPDYITITPDNQYALVLNRDSGDMTVLLIHAGEAYAQRYLGRKGDLAAAALFTMIPVGSKPVSAAVRTV
jgi:DNA-binding beta-propeller fold protein YncE